MQNKIIAKYESKVWYRITKSTYIALFAFVFLFFNGLTIVEFLDESDVIGTFIFGNIIIIFVMGTVEGLFWYIIRGKWGYPKDDSSIGLEKPE